MRIGIIAPAVSAAPSGSGSVARARMDFYDDPNLIAPSADAVAAILPRS
jgi:hypothetical protein